MVSACSLEMATPWRCLTGALDPVKLKTLIKGEKRVMELCRH